MINTITPGVTLVGGKEGENLTGGGGDDRITTSFGNSQIRGEAGNDYLQGSDQYDEIYGGFGNDTIYGRGGDDYISEDQGNDLIDAGDGNDNVSVYAWKSNAQTILGGAGNDIMRVNVDYTSGEVSVNGGSGDDTLYLGQFKNGTVSGGAGRDVLKFSSWIPGSILFTDFQVGVSGDVLDISEFLKSSANGYDGSNPFTTGYLKLVQDGADALVQTGADGSKTTNYQTIARLQNTNINNLTADNFSPSFVVFIDDRPTGNNGDDFLVGDAGNNMLDGGLGDDTLSGLAGNDTLLGGDGSDSILGGAGNDSVLAGAGNDLIDVGTGNDVAQGGAGTDFLVIDWRSLSGATISRSVSKVGTGADASFSGTYTAKNSAGAVLSSVNFSGIENLTLNTQSVDLNEAVAPPAAAGVTIQRSSTSLFTTEAGGKVEYNVVLKRAPVDPVKIQFASSDTTEGKVLTPELIFTSANWNKAQKLMVQGVDDYLDDGNVAFNVTGKIVTTDLNYNRLTIPGINLVNNDDTEDAPLVFKGTRDVDYFQGKNGNDRIYGGLDQDQLKGGRGDDKIYGEHDDDRLYGEDGNDKLYGFYDDDLLDGGTGSDSLYGEQGLDTLLGGIGNDYLDGGIENDSMVGGAGNDTYLVDSVGDKINDLGATSDVDTVLVLQTINYTLPANVENAAINATGNANLTGNALNNGLAGNDAKNVLDGGAGNDNLDGGAGADSLLGGVGNDAMIGGAGNDTMRGGDGVDLADFAAAGVDIRVDLATGRVTGDGTDLLFDIENILAGEGDDTLLGSTAANDLDGGAGIDALNGGAGNDTLAGCFFGSNGGQGEIDTLVGGVGNDIFQLGWASGRFYDDGNTKNAGRNDYVLITDFMVGQDKLQLDGAASGYYLGASGVAGGTGTGLYAEQGATDELIAIIRSTSTTALSAANTVNTALFV